MPTNPAPALGPEPVPAGRPHRHDRTRQTDLATRADSLPLLRLLGDLGFDPNLKGDADMPPIHAAAWWGHADIVEMYL